MRGDDQICSSLFSYIDLKARDETGHPLRAIREIANNALAVLSGELTSSRYKRIALRTITLMLALTLLSDCQVIGPSAIEHGRLNYTNVIENTSKQQTFDNILYVHNHQMPEFMDVTTINAQVLSSASLTASGVAHVGTVSGTLQYQESPTITYTPLFGKTLVAQIASPISIDSLSDIINSGWPIGAVLDFALDRLTPNPDDHLKAVNAIQELWDDDAIIIGPGIYQPDSSDPNPPPNKKKKLTESPISRPRRGATVGPRPAAASTSSTSGSTTKMSDSSDGNTKSTTPADSLVLYFNPDGLHKTCSLANWISLLRIYHLISDTANPSPQSMPMQIVLRSIPARPVLLTPALPRISAPLILTRSAFGVLRAGTRASDNFIGFISPDQYSQIGVICNYTNYYGVDHDIDNKIVGCGDSRKYILIIQSNIPSKNAYVQNFDERSKLYNYIDIDDVVSQTNFTLLSLFMIIQAAPGPLPPVPTITVGGR